MSICWKTARQQGRKVQLFFLLIVDYPKIPISPTSATPPRPFSSCSSQAKLSYWKAATLFKFLGSYYVNYKRRHRYQYQMAVICRKRKRHTVQVTYERSCRVRTYERLRRPLYMYSVCDFADLENCSMTFRPAFRGVSGRYWYIERRVFRGHGRM